MEKWVGLLRGINVGGARKLPMQELRDLANALGWENVKTYIQSGNMVFEAKSPKAELLAEAIEGEFGFCPEILLLRASEFLDIRAECPFESTNGKDVHIYFLAAPASADEGAIEALRAPSEEWALKTRAFYLFAPDGIARSKLAARVEKPLGVSATARNWNSVEKLAEMVEMENL